MKTHTFSFAYCAYSPDDPQLPNMDKVMLRAAREVALRAYAPYSAFQVGAALRLRSGRIVLGSNQENAAFPAVFVPNVVLCMLRQRNIPTIPLKFWLLLLGRNAFVLF